MAALQDLKQMVTELDDFLQCPVCYEVPTGHIYQCNQGHHVCGDCKQRIDLCPVCRSMFFGTRNYAMEELISNIRKLKVAKSLAAVNKHSVSVEDSGTTSSSPGTTSSSSSNTTLGLTDTDRTENTSEITRRPPVQCAGLFRCLCCINSPKERLPIARMLNHLRYWHSLDLIEGKLDSEQYEQEWQIPMQHGRFVIAVRVIELGIYFLVVEINSALLSTELHSWISMVASPIEADNYSYNLTFTGSDREATFSDTVMSVRSCEGQLKKRRRCLILDDENMQAFTRSQFVSVRLCIKRAAERRDELLRPEPRLALRIANRSLSDAGSTNSIHSPDMSIVRNNRIRDSAAAAPQQPTNQNQSQQTPRNQTQQAARTLAQNSAIELNRNPAANLPQQRNTSQQNSNINSARNTLNEHPQRAPAAPAQNGVPLSRNARRRLRRHLNLQARAPSNPPHPAGSLSSPVMHLSGVAVVVPADNGRPPVPPVNTNGQNRGQSNRNRRPHNRR